MEEQFLGAAKKLESMGLNVLQNESLSRHSTIKCGGPASIFFEPDDFAQIKASIKILRDYGIKFIISGNGSNTLFSDRGVFGAVIRINKKYFDYKFYFDDKIFVSAGMSLKKISDILLKNSLTGFEFAAHIPATLGGAVYGNAGAHEMCIADCIESVLSYDYIKDTVKLRKKSECAFSYRNSVFSQNSEIILGAVLSLNKGEQADIRKKTAEFLNYRKITQPLEFPSLGSVFKRDGEIIPARLIDACGLKGEIFGGAMVSLKHAGFIVNFNNATSKNVTSLIDMIKLKVYTKYNIKLKEEIKIIGD